MRTLQVIFVCESRGSERAMPQYAAFLDSLGQRLGQAIPSVALPLCEVKLQADFVILETLDVDQSLAKCDLSEQAALANRLIPIYPRRGKGTFHAQMERLSLAGALEAHAVAGWSRMATAERTEGLTGRRNVAALINATCMDDLTMPPAGYCFMVSTRHDGLAHLLADYLQCLAQQQTA